MVVNGSGRLMQVVASAELTVIMMKGMKVFQLSWHYILQLH